MLLQRSGYRLLRPGHPFYILGNVNDATFAPWKVVWPNMGDRIDACIISSLGGRPILPQHIVSLVPLDSELEAHYVCAIVNSTPFQFAAHAYSQAGGKSFGTPHILENICIPTFESGDPNHQRLSELSQHAHALAPAAAAAAGDGAAQAKLAEVEAEIDRAAARLWGLRDEELADIQASLEELKG